MAQPTANFDRTIALFEKPPVHVADEATFSAVKRDIETSFAAGNQETFLKSLERGGLRIRNFEAVVGAGKLGLETAAKYKKLTDGDQGLIREFYLASLEQVNPRLRDKYFRLYAYY